MKLKKIASLALAGVMAVSMLAGCAGKTGTTNEGGATVTTTNSIVDAINNGQNVNNKVKVTFTDNASLDAGLKKAIELAGDSEVTVTAVENLTGIKDVKTGITNSGISSGSKIYGFLGADANVATIQGSGKKLPDEGTVYTLVYFEKLDALNADAAQKQAVNKANAVLSLLDETTYKEGTTKDNDNYYNYSYTGNVAMASQTTSSGVTTYYAVMVLNQAVSVEKL